MRTGYKILHREPRDSDYVISDDRMAQVVYVSGDHAAVVPVEGNTPMHNVPLSSLTVVDVTTPVVRKDA